VDVLNFFTRLKGISDKLPQLKADKPKENDQVRADTPQESPAQAENGDGHPVLVALPLNLRSPSTVGADGEQLELLQNDPIALDRLEFDPPNVLEQESLPQTEPQLQTEEQSTSAPEAPPATPEVPELVSFPVQGRSLSIVAPSGDLLTIDGESSLLPLSTPDSSSEIGTLSTTTPAKKPNRFQALFPTLSKAGAATGASIKFVGSTIAKPFQGEKPLHKKPLFWAGTAVGATSLALGGVWLYVDNSVGKYSPLDALSYVRPGTVTIKGVDGTILLQTGNATRDNLKLWQMPDKLTKAFVAIEDRRFYEHDGVDYKGVTRAMLSNLTSKGLVEGASSINQQVARMVYLNQERSFWRKIREIRLAQKLGTGLTKDQVLERYLNLVYLGEGAYGVADSSWVYFSKTVDQLTLAEMATLAAMPPAPNKYSPFVNPEFAKARRNLVLQRMQEAGFITAGESQSAQAEPLVTKRGFLKRQEQEARYFTKYIEQELPKYLSENIIKQGGLTIETTLNQKWQERAEEVINKTVRNNRGSFGQAAMVAIDPRTGGIRSMVGGTDFAKNQFNRVTQAQRQPGSTFKPFVYATAIAGGISPHKSYIDAPLDIDGYKPKNAGKAFRGSISMRDALVNSINIVAIKVLVDSGFEPTIEMAKKMGIESKLEPYYSLALGGLEVNLLELTGGYTTFANRGLRNPVHGITRITNQKGEVLYHHKPEAVKVLEPGTSDIMTWMMSGVVNEGTATSAQIGRPVAGKTGTTDKARDLWFIGYIPQLVTGVWLGNDNNQVTGNASSTAAYAWSQFMRTATETIPVQKLPSLPDNLDKRKPEIKLDRVRYRYMRTLAAPAKDEDTAEGRRTRRSDSSEERPRRRRYRSEESSERPRRRRSE
jgi:penicillin-binding protein 1A